MVTVILRRNCEFSLQLSAVLSTQGFKATLRSIIASRIFHPRLKACLVMKLPLIFCSQHLPSNVPTHTLRFSSPCHSFVLGAIVLVCLQQEIQPAIDRVEAVCRIFREKVIFSISCVANWVRNFGQYFISASF
jgi:hypothetical protein